jgi:hypothetical protein
MVGRRAGTPVIIEVIIVLPDFPLAKTRDEALK